MLRFYEQNGYCFCPIDTEAPELARPCASPFSPLIFLVKRDPLKSRGYWRIHSLRQLQQAEDWRLLLPQGTDELVSHGAGVLNTAFSRCFTQLDRCFAPKKRGFRLTLAGLGDVGGTLLTALKLLGDDVAEIGIYDPNEALCRRYEMELNQVLYRPQPRIVLRSRKSLFDCDAFLFTASKGVPPLGTQGDVRLLQLKANRALLEDYSLRARQEGFSGLFCQISDPVDLLARCVFLQSNRNEAGEQDAGGLLPEQVLGFGLGVMAARAAYLAERNGLSADKLCAYGPHGAGLVIANDPMQYNEQISAALTEQTVRANLEVRALGFKPYIAPAISSACLNILRALRGESFLASVPLGGVWFGAPCRRTPFGLELVEQEMHPALQARIAAAYDTLGKAEALCMS